MRQAYMERGNRGFGRHFTTGRWDCVAQLRGGARGRAIVLCLRE